MKRAIEVLALCAAVASAGGGLGCSSSKASAGAGQGATDAGSGDAAAEACAMVQTANGPVLAGPLSATCTYLGIPFAAPPTGALRWKAPQPADSWTTPRPSAPASGCPQNASEFGVASTDEDCLYLNVWSPKPHASTPLPVMVFVHGGSFLWGSGTFPLYDGTNLAAATDHIVVTLNYRLGAFGFLSNPDLRAEDPTNSSTGEYALEDQIAALQWVQTNIASFGGDPKNVTLFGESAGGTSMFLHLISPKSAGLFQRVIIESGAATGGTPAAPMAAGDQTGAAFATAMGCTDPTALLTCLRGKAVSDILATEGQTDSSINWFPVVDGVVIPQDPLSLYAAGTINKVPTILGNNKNEGGLFVFTNPPTDDASYLAYADASLPGKGAQIVAQYPISAYGNSYLNGASAILTDATFLCPTRTIARWLAASGAPVFRYDFVHALENPPFAGLGAFHGSELVFVFGNPIAGVFGLQPDEAPLSQLMMGYWGSMATSGTPNGGSRFTWPAYDTTTETELVLDTTQSTETELEKATCDFWDGLEGTQSP